MRLFLLIQVVLFFVAAPALAGEGTHKLDIRLMTETDTKSAGQCGLRLWQKNRDPATDKYAYAFAMPVTADTDTNRAGSGLVQIGGTIETVDRIASGGKTYGPVHQHQVFRKPGTDLTIVVDLLEFAAEGDGLEIFDGRVTIYDIKRLPFAVRVAGGYYCAATAKSESTARTGSGLVRVKDIKAWNDVPPAVLSEARGLKDCDHDGLGTVWGALFKISETRQIWEIPCFLGAYQGAMIYVYEQTDQPAVWLMPFKAPNNRADDQSWLMEPRFNVETGIVTSLELGRAAADCGKYQRHRLVAHGDGDNHAFELIEFREKPDCDEVFIPVEEFPLIYSK